MAELTVHELHWKKECSKAASQRSSVYYFLALFYRHEPDEELIQFLKKPEVLRGFEEAKLALNVKKLYEGPVEAVLRNIGTEYTRLFIGPGQHVPLNESVYCDNNGLLFGKSTVAVIQFIEQTGLELDTDWRGLPDHISVELELMQHLTQHEAEIWIADNLVPVNRCIMTEQMFMQKHILQWIPQLCDKVLELNPLPLFRDISKFTKKFITFDIEYINNLAGNNP